MADIELLIKVPEYYYENNIKKDLPIYLTEDNIIKILPKGHGRLIDADALYEDLIFPNEQFSKAFKEILDDAPTIIEADRAESEGDYD